MTAESTITALASRPREFVRVAGPAAEDYLQRMVSNDVEALGPGESCEALLLTPKARVIAPLRVLRRNEDDFLLVTEPGLGERVRSELMRMRFAARAEIELEPHDSYLLLGPEPPPGALAVPNDEYGQSAWEVLDAPRPDDVAELDAESLEALRITAGTPRFGNEVDDRVLPAEAGLVPRAVSLSKGCYPGQEPVARLHYRGHANRTLRRLLIEGDPPEHNAELLFGEKVVGRVTSSARANGRVVALAYVRTEVPEDAELGVGDAKAKPLH